MTTSSSAHYRPEGFAADGSGDCSRSEQHCASLAVTISSSANSVSGGYLAASGSMRSVALMPNQWCASRNTWQLCAVQINNSHCGVNYLEFLICKVSADFFLLPGCARATPGSAGRCCCSHRAAWAQVLLLSQCSGHGGEGGGGLAMAMAAAQMPLIVLRCLGPARTSSQIRPGSLSAWVCVRCV